MTTIVVIPARNEADNIEEVVSRVVSRGYRCIVVDDGSNDGTGILTYSRGAYNVRTGGVGIALATIYGMQEALHRGASTVVTMDAGLSHYPVDIPQMLVAINDGADMVIGSRFCKNGLYIGRWHRKLLSRLYASVMNFSQRGASYKDWTSGFRAYRTEVIQYLLSLSYTAKGHAWQAETLARAGEKGFRIKETPITYRAGDSSFSWKSAQEALVVQSAVMHHMGGVGERESSHSVTHL